MARPLSLTPQQDAAVKSIGRAYLLAAPPGSGKTEVLVRRAIWLLQESTGETFRILALTFTNRAADNLRGRIRDEVRDEEWRVFTGTFHSFCLDVLENYGSSIGFNQQITIYNSDDDRAEVLREGLSEEGFEVQGIALPQLRAVLTQIDRLKWELVPPDAAPSTPLKDLPMALDVAYEAYEAMLERYGAIDFSGMLMKAYQLLVSDTWVADHYRQLYRHVLVDEGQDLNLAQYQILRLLFSPARNLLMVADRNQSIYRFTGASPKYLDRFIADFDALELPLTTNFRSALAIVRVANKLGQGFAKGSGQVTDMSSGAGAEGSVEAWSFPSDGDEARGVCAWIEASVANGLNPDWLHEGEDPSVEYEDVCILARTRFALEAVAEELTSRAIPFVMRTGEAGLFDSDLAKSVYYALRLIQNPNDLPSARRLRALIPGLSSWEVEDDSGDGRALTALTRAANTESGLPEAVIDLLLGLQARSLSIAEFVEAIHVLKVPGLDSVDEEGAIVWAADQDEIEKLWRRYAIRVQSSERDLAGYLRYISQAQKVTLDEPGVRVLTVHAAKGLEFRLVALVGMNDGMFPYYLSLSNEEELDEERRNAYVAVTRAARALRITRPASRQTRYGIRSDEPSRFIGEMGLSLLGQPRATPF